MISSSINSFKGEVDKSMSEQISKVNSKIDTEVEAVYTITRGAITKVPLDVVFVSENDGIVTVEISGENLKKEYYDGEIFASVSLKIENDQNHFATDYIDMVPFKCE